MIDDFPERHSDPSGPHSRPLGLHPLLRDGRRSILIAILMVAAALRLAALDTPLYVDEISTITVASRPLAEMSEAMREIDASPALYPVLLHAWMGISHHDGWLRLLSAIFGILTVPMVALVGTSAFGWRAGLAAAFVIAIAPAHVHYSQYVRSYSLFTLLAALQVWLILAWFDSDAPPGLRRGAAIAMVTAALLYTHYLSLLLLAGEGLLSLGRLRDRPRRVLGLGAAVAVAGLLFVPAVPLLLHNAAFDRVRNVDRPDPAPLARLVPDLAAELMVGQRSLGFSDLRVRRWTLAGAALVFPTLWLVGVRRGLRERPGMVLALCAVSVVPIAIYLLSGRKLVAVRFFLPFAVGYIVLIGYGLATLRGAARLGAATALAVVCAIPLWHYYSTFSWSYDHRGVARAIAAQSRPGDLILVTHPYEAFFYRWYLGDRLPIRGLLFTPIEEQETYVIKPAALEVAAAQARVSRAAAAHPRLWIVGQSRRSFAADAAAEAKVLAWMDRTYRRAGDLDALTNADPVVRLYDVGRAPAGPLQ